MQLTDAQRYPKWKYHPAGEARIVANALKEDLLGPWWFDTPRERDEALTIALSEVLLAQSPATPSVLVPFIQTAPETPVETVLTTTAAETAPIVAPKKRRAAPRRAAPVQVDG